MLISFNFRCEVISSWTLPSELKSILIVVKYEKKSEACRPDDIRTVDTCIEQSEPP